MEHSYNGFPASRNPREINVVPFAVDGVTFVGGVREGYVHTILHHVVTQFDNRVEPLMRAPGCWGWSYRQNRNSNNLSNHSSATAVDVNAPKHPNGVPTSRTFSRKQINEMHTILREIEELDEVVKWGGDYNGTPDAMHFEMLTNETAKLKRVVERIENFGKPEYKETHVEAAHVLLVNAETALIKARRELRQVPEKRRVARAQAGVLWGIILSVRAVRTRLPKK